MIPLKTIAICVGIGISVIGFGLILYTVLPLMIQNNAWDNFNSKITKEELLEKFKEHPAYAAFYEKFPDAREVLNYNSKRHDGDIQIGVANFEKANTLKLELRYNNYDDSIFVNITCFTNNGKKQSTNTNGLFVVEYIEQTNCLELTADDDDIVLGTGSSSSTTIFPRIIEISPP